MKKDGYAVSDDSRFIKAEKIIACLEWLGKDLQDKEVLDIGCGAGIISGEISRRCKQVTAIDITDEALKEAMQSYSISEIAFQFIIGDGTRLPFPDASFDIIVCNQVYEHVRDQDKLINDIYRVLRPEGLCYMATGNKLWPIEPHTKLPFLSYLPKSIADKYARRFRGIDEYDVTLPTYWKLKRILSNRFDKVSDLTPLVIKYPQKFYLTNEIPKLLSKILKRIPLRILRKLLPFYPSWIIVVRK